MPNLDAAVAVLLFVVPGYVGLWVFDQVRYKDEKEKRPPQDVLIWSYCISLIAFATTDGLADHWGLQLNTAETSTQVFAQVFSMSFAGRVALMGAVAAIGSWVLGHIWHSGTKRARKRAKRSQPSGYCRVWNGVMDCSTGPYVMVEMDDGQILKGAKIDASSSPPDKELLLVDVERFVRVQGEDGQITFTQVPWNVEKVLIDGTKATCISFLHKGRSSRIA